ncbi:unnamed protein product [Closterium sp. NIES-53]
MLVGRHPALPAMASLSVLTFNHEGRPIQFDMWLDDLQLYLLSDSRDNVSLFDHTSGASLDPPATADSATRSQWLTRDAAACLAICNHLPLAEHAHFGQHKTAKALYDAVVARYSSPATAALDRLILPYLFPSSETSVVTVGVARSTPCTPFFEGCSPSPLAPSFTYATAVDILGTEDVGAASALSGKRRSDKGKGGRVVAVAAGVVMVEAVEVAEVVVGVVAGVGASVAAVVAAVREVVAVVVAVGVVAAAVAAVGVELFRGEASGGSVRCPYVILTGDRAGQTCGKFHTQHCCFSRLDDAWREEFGDKAERPRWLELLRSGVDIFALDYDAILAAMYALSVSAKGDCYLCVPPDPSIEAAALGASESALPGIPPTEALHTFTLDSGASRCFFCNSTTLTPLLASVPVRLTDPSGGPFFVRSSSVLPCPAIPSGSLLGLHLSSFSTNLVSTAALQDAMVTTTTPGGQRVSICTCTQTGRHLATFTHRPGWSLYTLTTEPPQVAASGQVSASGPVAAPCSCHLLSLPPLPPLPAPPCLPSVEGGYDRGCYFLLVVDDYTRYTMVSPLRSKGEVPDVLISWIRAVRLQLRERFRADFPVLHLHFDRGSEFSSDLLRDLCCGEGILQSFTLPASPQQNGDAELRLGLVMEAARTSMIHAAAPHFLWPFAVRYTAHQLNLWPRVSLPETLPTLRWTRKVGNASVFWVWGSRTFVRDTSADKLSSRAIPCVFLGFPLDAPGCRFPFTVSSPTAMPLSPPRPLFLTPGPPPVDPLPPQGPAPSGVSQVDPLPLAQPVEVTVDSGAARGTACGGAEPTTTERGGAEPASAELGGAEPGGAEPEGAEPGGAESEGVEFGGVEPRGTASAGADDHQTEVPW